MTPEQWLSLAGAAVVAAAVTAIFQLLGAWRDRAQREQQERREHERFKLDLAHKLLEKHIQNWKDGFRPPGNDPSQPTLIKPMPEVLLNFVRAIDSIEASRSWTPSKENGGAVSEPKKS